MANLAEMAGKRIGGTPLRQGLTTNRKKKVRTRAKAKAEPTGFRQRPPSVRPTGRPPRTGVVGTGAKMVGETVKQVPSRQATPKMLGSGLAHDAARKIRARRKLLDNL